MVKKNKMFILEKPKHFIAAMLVWFPNLDCLENEDLSRKLDLLRESFDLYFVFPQSLSGIVDLEKYSSLSMATGYCISDNDDQCQAMWWATKYVKLMLTGSYAGIYLASGDCIDLEKDTINSLVSVASNNLLNIGVMKYDRLNYGEIYKLCKKPEKTDLIFSWKYAGSDPRGMYSTHVCTSNFIYLRGWIIDSIDKFLKGEADYTMTPGNLFLDSFEGQWIGNFIASWVVKTKEPEKVFLNMNLSDVKA